MSWYQACLTSREGQARRESSCCTFTTALTALGHDVDTVADEGLGGCPDDAVWMETQTEGRFLVTQDLDFSDIRVFKPGTHHGVLLVRLAAPGRRALLERVQALFQAEDVASWGGCFVVTSERKLRIRHPEHEE